MFKSRKSLKIKKIALVVCSVFILLSFTCGAVYTSGDANTPRYTSPLRFDFEIFGTTAQLTPTISYASGQTLTYDTQETSTQANSVVTSINRTNFSVSTFNTTAIEVAYRLKFDVTESVDSFTLKIVATDGIYDFVKYGIPVINVPTGYTASVTTSYWQRFTQSQSYTSAISVEKRSTDSYSGNDNIPLLFNEVIVNGVNHDIVGGVIIQDYETVITFTNDGPSGTDGPRYYMWDPVLSIDINSDLAESWQAVQNISFDATSIWFNEPVTISCLLDGVVSSFEVTSFLIADIDGLIEWELQISSGDITNVIAYDTSNDMWYAWDDEEVTGYEITSDNMRLWYFSSPLDDTWSTINNDSEFDTSQELSIYEEFAIQTKLWFVSSTTEYVDNPLQSVQTTEGASTYAFTDGDGGMYLRYYADRMLSDEFSATVSDYYGFAYGNGFANGDGGFTRDYSGWLAAAVSGFTSLEIFPNFSVGGVLGVIVALCLLILFLKFFAGG